MGFAFALRTKGAASIFSAAMLTALGAAGGTGAHASGLFVLGSTFQVDATNSPNSFSDTANLVAGSQLLDGGAITLNILIRGAV